MAMAQRDYIKGFTENKVEHMRLSQVIDEFKNDRQEDYRKINVYLMLVFHLLQISDKFFADIEDILQDNNQFRFEVKRKHKDIAKDIHDNYMPLFKKLQGKGLDDMYLDNMDLENTIRVWSGLEQGKKVIVENIPTDGESITAQYNVVGDIILRNSDGWIIQLPKNFQDNLNVERSVADRIDKGETVPCGLRIYIGKEIE